MRLGAKCITSGVIGSHSAHMLVALILGQIAAVEFLGDLPKLGLERVNRPAGQNKPRRAEAGRG